MHGNSLYLKLAAHSATPPGHSARSRCSQRRLRFDVNPSRDVLLRATPNDPSEALGSGNSRVVCEPFQQLQFAAAVGALRQCEHIRLDRLEPGYSSRMSHTQLHLRLRYEDEASFAAPFLEMSGSLCLSADRVSDAGREHLDPSSHSPGVDPLDTRTTREHVKKEPTGRLTP